MNKFAFKYPLLVWILLGIILAFCGAGLAFNIVNIINYSGFGFFKIFPYILIIIVSAFLIVFVISLLVHCRYVIKKEHIYLYFGFIFSKTNIFDIVALSHFKKSDKLVIYLKDQKYSVIVISKMHYDNFLHAIRKVNPQIVYDAKIEED